MLLSKRQEVTNQKGIRQLPKRNQLSSIERKNVDVKGKNVELKVERLKELV